MFEVPSILRSAAPFGRRTAPNRFLSQPMEGNDGESGGSPSARTISRYAALGRGNWGVGVVEAASVVPDCLARVNQLVLERNNLDGFKRLVAAYKEANPDGLLLIQITHSGRKGSGGTVPTTLTPGGPAGARLLSTAEVEDIRRRFVSASLLAEDAGADGIDFKMCHGYFGAELLRPSNDRTDAWGGSWENRSRFLTESIPEIRAAAVHPDFLVGVRISMYEGIRGGCGTTSPDDIIEDLSEMTALATLLHRLGADYINISAGIPGETSEITRPVPQSRWFYLHHARYSKIVMDTLRSAAAPGQRPAVVQSAFSILKAGALEFAAECVDRGYADFAGFGRQQFADPETPAKLMRGEEPLWCVACSGCSKLMAKQVHDGCSFHDSYYRGLLTVGTGS
jgi:2,4-dienoyl-CoA reductase-like NADH-dependent reductase (Old Yellow Enzyme family)